MVPLTVARLKQLAAQTGGDPADETTRWACMKEIVKGTTRRGDYRVLYAGCCDCR